ncbi:hypothetical protein EVAR_80593_1 [Eumeta japonica]|uniref:Uncharacterized protein n=1 Tax=Eumeta variegata TaxID=151549 RepID=A0A4C1TLN4_EUMVA|nr:hypothetical protein EVAR_80593_1 [Eumeta japonica]
MEGFFLCWPLDNCAGPVPCGFVSYDAGGKTDNGAVLEVTSWICEILHDRRWWILTAARSGRAVRQRHLPATTTTGGCPTCCAINTMMMARSLCLPAFR